MQHCISLVVCPNPDPNLTLTLILAPVDWITTVYGSEHTFRVPDIQIKHNVAAQKEHGFTRYEVDKGTLAI